MAGGSRKLARSFLPYFRFALQRDGPASREPSIPFHIRGLWVFHFHAMRYIDTTSWKSLDCPIHFIYSFREHAREFSDMKSSSGDSNAIESIFRAISTKIESSSLKWVDFFPRELKFRYYKWIKFNIFFEIQCCAHKRLKNVMISFFASIFSIYIYRYQFIILY